MFGKHKFVYVFLVIVISLSITALNFPMLSMRALRFCNLLKAHFIHYNNKAHMYTIFSKRREMFNVRTWQWMDEKCFTYSYSRVFVLKFGGFLRGIMLFVLQPASASHASTYSVQVSLFPLWLQFVWALCGKGGDSDS